MKSTPPNDNFVAANYWQDLAAHQDEGCLVIEFEKAKLAIAGHHGGSKAFVVFDGWEPDQIISSDSYLGYTSEANKNETVHVHTRQAEKYIILEGTAEIWSKHYWEGSNSWKRCVLKQKDIALVMPQTCHLFQWRSETGVAAVTKAPNNMGGVGRPPAAKMNCADCPRFHNGCDGLKAV